MISGDKIKTWWFSPRDGSVQDAGVFENSGIKRFDAPGETSRGNDWMLVLDDVSAGCDAPYKSQI